MNYAYKVPFFDQIGYEINVVVVGFAFFICLSGFILGARIGEYNYVFGNQSSNLLNRVDLNINVNEYLIYFLCLVTIVIGFLTYDVNDLVLRDSYVVEGNNKLVIFHKLMLIISSFLVAFVRSSFCRIILFLLMIVVPFSLNSRTLSLCILLFYLGVFVKNDFYLNYKDKVSLIFLLVFSFLITLGFRSQSQQGLIPNFVSLLNFDLDAEIVWNSINYVTSYSVFATQYAIDNNYSDLQAFLISINPLPSVYLDVNYLENYSKINVYSPVPAIAMSFNAGPFFSFFYYFLSGFIFSHILKQLKNSRFYFIVVSFFFLFIFTNSQYIIREGTRIIYYLILFYFFRKILTKFKWS